MIWAFRSVLCRPGSDLLSRVLRRSTIGAEEFNGRVRDGIGFRLLAIATRPAKHMGNRCGVQRAKLDLMRTSSGSVERMNIEDENDQANRGISTGKLNVSPRLHTRPINVVVCHGS